jgi:hypothetical protein
MRTRISALAALLALSALVFVTSCTSDERKIPLTEWVESMVNNEEEPDVVDDKPAIVLVVEDQAPFEKYFDR